MTPRAHALLRARYEAAGMLEDGWIFPKGTNPEEHITDSLTKNQHKKALKDSGVAAFVPYTMRHTALTRFGEAADNNMFAVAQIAGHDSLTSDPFGAVPLRWTRSHLESPWEDFNSVGT